MVEQKQPQPLLAVSLCSSIAFVAANATQFLVGVALIMATVNVPLIANTVMAREPLTGALLLMRLTGAILVGAILRGLSF